MRGDEARSRERREVLVRQSVGTFIRERRKLLGLSQEGLRRRLAREAGVRVAQATLSRWERGEAAPPLEVLPVLAKTLASPLESIQEAISLALARSREEIDLTGKDPHRLLLDADKAAATGNLSRALVVLEALDDLLRLDGKALSPEDRGRALLKLAWVHQHLWHLEAARDALRRFSEMAPDLPDDTVFRGMLQRFLLAHRYGDHLAADGLEKLLREHLAGRPPELRAEAYHVLGSRAYGAQRYEEALALFREALDGWLAVDRPLEVARSRALLGYCLARTGDATAGEDELRTARADAASLRALEVEIQARRLLGRLLAETGRVAEGIAELEDAAALARRAGLATEEFICLWRALELGPAEKREEYAARLRRLLRWIDPRLPEARDFAGAGLAAGDEDEEDER